jgi:hypothetical protein
MLTYITPSLICCLNKLHRAGLYLTQREGVRPQLLKRLFWRCWAFSAWPGLHYEETDHLHFYRSEGKGFQVASRTNRALLLRRLDSARGFLYNQSDKASNEERPFPRVHRSLQQTVLTWQFLEWSSYWLMERKQVPNFLRYLVLQIDSSHIVHRPIYFHF